MPEQRKSNRTRTLLCARAVFNGGLSSVDCHVRDISDVGARVVVASDGYLPDEFQLEIPRRNQVEKVSVRRRAPGFIGVEFFRETRAPGHVDLSERVKTLETENLALRKRITEMARRLDSYGDSERSPI